MLTTTVDGLWVLQVLCGIETVAAELGLRPHFPRVEGPEVAVAHPEAEELRRAGVITDCGNVDSSVREWLTVLSRRDVAVGVFVQHPSGQFASDRVLFARFSCWWVALERCGSMVRLSAVGRAYDERTASMLLGAQIDRLCGQRAPARMDSLTIDVQELTSSVLDGETLQSYLIRHGLDVGQVAALTAAADSKRSRQVSIVAIQSGVTDAPAGIHVDPGVVTVIDSPHGRLISEQLNRDGKTWMIVGPGSQSAMSSAVLAMLRRLPAEDWFSHRRAV
ncbi:MAG: ESX secretion-associated protein EspG [Mycobacterium sp.]|nr:ESX secretion-associated protein EspG [Mycobacterium sp.]